MCSTVYRGASTRRGRQSDRARARAFPVALTEVSPPRGVVSSSSTWEERRRGAATPPLFGVFGRANSPASCRNRPSNRRVVVKKNIESRCPGVAQRAPHLTDRTARQVRTAIRRTRYRIFFYFTHRPGNGANKFIEFFFFFVIFYREEGRNASVRGHNCLFVIVIAARALKPPDPPGATPFRATRVLL